MRRGEPRITCISHCKHDGNGQIKLCPGPEAGARRPSYMMKFSHGRTCSRLKRKELDSRQINDVIFAYSIKIQRVCQYVFVCLVQTHLPTMNCYVTEVEAFYKIRLPNSDEKSSWRGIWSTQTIIAIVFLKGYWEVNGMPSLACL